MGAPAKCRAQWTLSMIAASTTPAARPQRKSKLRCDVCRGLNKLYRA
jgi:hypothetical protein